jgi:hypothetical protein
MGAQHRFTVRAFIVELACISGHGFGLVETAERTGKQGLQTVSLIGCHFRTVDGKPESVVARVNASGLVLSGS